MPRNDSLDVGELTDTSYYILLSLMEPKHGYLIMKSIEELTNHSVVIGPASMYTTIKKLLAAGLIELFDKSEKKKVYVTTKKGVELVRKEIERKRIMIQHGEAILENKGE
ncbi:PadR family transcriptional regulator [Guptibacillus sedimenti]|uniref:PadR family transcriptional regulator n=1 Tax=Guptibacillus sedimenti TaxID=3025680 RepID=UPI00235E2948|nr:PadR family transcriptional regulator [Pseudalkalibacillus sedimenti]